MLPAQSSRIQRELASLHCPASPAPHSLHAGKQDSGRSLATAPRSIALAGAAVGGWRPSFWKASEGSFGTHRVSVRGWRGWPQAGVVWRRPPGAVHGDSRQHAAESTARCTWCALATTMPTSLSLLPAATPALRLPARPLALRSLTVTPAGRARRLAKPARVPPRPPLGPPRPALSAQLPSQSPSPAARYFHTSQWPGLGA